MRKINKKSLDNLKSYKAIQVTYDGKSYKSIHALAKKLNMHSSRVSEALQHDKPINDKYLDYAL